MNTARILLADNDASFLEICSRYVALAGYEVKKAHSPDEARRVLEDGLVHLAVLDFRLLNDEDEKDWSGLEVAKSSAHFIPKIMLTAFQTWEAVREALGTADTGLPPAVDFVAKQEGLAALLERIEQALARHVRRNWNLHIDWRAHDHLSIVKLADPGLEGERLLARGEEFVDLLRAHFHNKDQLVVERLLWRRGGCVALGVHSFAQGMTLESRVVVCGRRESVREEAGRYREFAPQAPGQTGTVLEASSATQHLALNSYALAGADLEQVTSLRELYRTAPEATFGAALAGLFQQTLAEWHEGKRVAEEEDSLDGAYRRRLGLADGEGVRAALDERVRFLVRQVPTLGHGMSRDDGNVSLHFGGHVVSYTDPTMALARKLDLGELATAVKVPGSLTGENVLAAPNGRAWLTDFSEAGMAPVLWNYVALESAIRFEWVEVNNLQWLHGMELALTEGEFGKVYASDFEPPLRKAARAVQSVRRLAAGVVNRNHAAYHAGVMFQALRRLTEFDPGGPVTTGELARAAHVLLAAAVIYSRLTRGASVDAAASPDARPGLRIDPSTQEVWINGARVPLRGQSYELLLDLYNHANQLRTRRALIEHLFKEVYDELNPSQEYRLNTAVRRLREKIEDDPDAPRFLLTEKNGGYRLVV